MKNGKEKQLMVDGMMVFGKLENELRTLDFQCCEDVVTEAFVGTFKVQAMRDGNVYATEKPRRIRNKPLFRQDHSSLTLGHDGRYYFILTMDKAEAKELPATLMEEALEASQKMINHLKYDCYGK